jgi:hypothetical protein
MISWVGNAERVDVYQPLVIAAEHICHLSACSFDYPDGRCPPDGPASDMFERPVWANSGATDGPMSPAPPTSRGERMDKRA